MYVTAACIAPDNKLDAMCDPMDMDVDEPNCSAITQLQTEWSHKQAFRIGVWSTVRKGAIA